MRKVSQTYIYVQKILKKNRFTNKIKHYVGMIVENIKRRPNPHT